MLDTGTPTQSLSFDAEQFLDYQVARPIVELDSTGKHRVKFPSLDIIELESPLGSTDIDRLSILHGYEPNRNWLTFVSDMVDAIETLDIDVLVFLGAMLADNPHSRPVQVMATTDNLVVQQELGLAASDYEGPVGIFSAVAEAAEAIDVPAISIWASVPHYAHTAPSPKATLALLLKLAEFTGIELAFDALVAEAKAWEHSIDAMTADDADMTQYISQLEQARDAVDSPDASGEAIAKEFEEYLRENEDEDSSSEGDVEDTGDDEGDSNDGDAGGSGHHDPPSH